MGRSHQRPDPWRCFWLPTALKSLQAWGFVCGDVSCILFGKVDRLVTKPSPKGLKRQAGLEGGIPFTPLCWAYSQSVAECSWLAGREKQLRERMWLLCKTLFCYRINKKMVAKHSCYNLIDL